MLGINSGTGADLARALLAFEARFFGAVFAAALPARRAALFFGTDALAVALRESPRRVLVVVMSLSLVVVAVGCGDAIDGQDGDDPVVDFDDLSKELLQLRLNVRRCRADAMRGD